MKTTTTGELELPIITDVYDLLSGRHDGTITPQAPVMVSGVRLNLYPLEEVRLCLVPEADTTRVIDVLHIYKYHEDKVLLTLPILEVGTYHPAFRLMREGEEPCLCILPQKLEVIAQYILKDKDN